MAKALLGHRGEGLPPDVVLRELRSLAARVAELERDLAVIEQELALRGRLEADNARLRGLLAEAERQLADRRAPV